MADPLSIETWRGIISNHKSKFGWAIVLVFAIPLVGVGVSQFGGRQNPAAQAAKDLEEPVVKVNGETIARRQVEALLQRASQGAGEQNVLLRGMAVDRLVQQVILQQEAKARNAKADDAEVDKTIAQLREQIVGKDGNETQWQQAIRQQYNMSPADFREQVAKEMVIPALVKQFEGAENVSEADAKNDSAEAKLSLVLIPTTENKTPIMAKGVKALPDAEAKKKAEDLLASVKGGADIKAVAKANSGDMSGAKGETNFLREFASFSMGGEDLFGSLGYGKAFDEAVRKTPLGQLTEVVKTTGSMTGYAFAKVLERRNNLPKDFDVKKKIQEMKQARAGVKFSEFLKEKVKAAKIEFLDPGLKTYYDFAKLQMEGGGMMGMMQPPQTANAAEKTQKEKAIIEGFEAILKKTPDDASVSLALASLLKTQRATAPDAAAREAIENRLVKLYETALKTTENETVRFDLAKIYQGKNQKDLAAAQYTKVAEILGASPLYDAQSAQKNLQTYMQVQEGLRGLGKGEEATKLTPKINEAMKFVAEEQKRQQEAMKLQQDALKNAPKTPPGGVTVAPGGTASSGGTVPAPAGGAKKPDAATPEPPKSEAPKTPSGN